MQFQIALSFLSILNAVCTVAVYILNGVLSSIGSQSMFGSMELDNNCLTPELNHGLGTGHPTSQ